MPTKIRKSSSKVRKHSRKKECSLTAAERIFKQSLPKRAKNLVNRALRKASKPHVSRPKSRYIQFYEANFRRVRAANPQVRIADIARIIGQMWRRNGSQPTMRQQEEDVGFIGPMPPPPPRTQRAFKSTARDPDIKRAQMAAMRKAQGVQRMEQNRL